MYECLVDEARVVLYFLLPATKQKDAEKQQQQQHQQQQQRESEQQALQLKKTRFVFTDVQRRTLKAIFKENPRPSKDMQIAIAKELALEVNTVSNFFMNARRRSRDKWLDEAGNNNRNSGDEMAPSPGGSCHSLDSSDSLSAHDGVPTTHAQRPVGGDGGGMSNSEMLDAVFIKTEDEANATAYVTSITHVTSPDMTLGSGGRAGGDLHNGGSDLQVTGTTFISNPEDLNHLNPTYVKAENEIKTELYDM